MDTKIALVTGASSGIGEATAVFDDACRRDAVSIRAPRIITMACSTSSTLQVGAILGRVLPVIERDDVVVIGGDDDGSMRTAPLGVLSGAVVVSVTGSSPR